MTANSTESKSDRNQNTTVAALVHIAGLLFGFIAIAFVYLSTDDEFIRENAMNALNWHVPVSLLAIVVVVLGIVVSETAGVALAVTIGIITVCVALIASMKARHGRAWKYPVVPQLL
jgi:uncharacterized membrane protein